ncbi:hypothetical protein TNIN_113871 [Trichonephila inaurata madagascariensis]|uniref:Uncharacterized protein n=1 Tax=Trichonephila inaurata madagascariensis TaxID=2747483 RepID=A0A8X7BSC3_9ARAC|nr:hypothetical protein TNIN_113871 [Trichonephila inaurata madagascariensis]
MRICRLLNVVIICFQVGKIRNAFDGEVEAFSLETTIDPSLQIREVYTAVRFKNSGTGRWVSRRPHFIRGSPMSRIYSMLAEEKQEISDTATSLEMSKQISSHERVQH